MPAEGLRATVIVVNWNGHDLLKRCLEALEMQTERSFEVVVVDNGSVDDSATLVRERFPSVRLVANERNLGFAAGNNVGIRQSNAPFVATLNNDAVPRPDWLASALRVIESGPAVGMVACKMLFSARPEIVNSGGIAIDRAAIAWDRLGGTRDHQSGEVEEVFGPCAGAALYRREMLEEVGLFDEEFFAYLEDVDLAWRARLAGWRCLYAPDAVVSHVHSATGVEGSPFKSYHLGRNKIWCVAKDYPSPQLYLWLPVIAAYDVAAVLYGVVKRGDLAALRGRVAGLLGLPRQLGKRRRIQKMRRASFTELSRQMSPLSSPFGVLRRYSHLNTEGSC